MAGILSDMSQGILGVLRKNNPRIAGILGAATDPQFYKDAAANMVHVPVGMTAAAIGAPADIMSMGSNFKPGEMPLSTDWLLKRWYAGRNEGVPETARIASMLPNDASDVAPLMKAMTVFHGSPHKFAPTPNNPLGEFDASKIGTGEGAQIKGYGLYFAENPEVAADYRKNLTRSSQGQMLVDGQPVKGDESWAAATLLNAKGDVDAVLGTIQRIAADPTMDAWKLRAESVKKLAGKNIKYEPAGALYTSDIPDSMIPKMLDWDAPLSKQPEAVKATLIKNDPRLKRLFESGKIDDMYQNGGEFYRSLTGRYASDAPPHMSANASEELFGQKAASDKLKQFGIPGIKYFDGGSRTAGEGTRNFVVFPGNEKSVKILKRE